MTGFRAPPQISLRLKLLIASLHLVWGTPTNISRDQRQSRNIKPKGFQFQLLSAGCCSIYLVLTITRAGDQTQKTGEGRDIYKQDTWALYVARADAFGYGPNAPCLP